MDSKGALSRATKDLLAKWSSVKEVWSDAQSQEFERVYLVQIEQDVRGALAAMDQMNQILQKLTNDCG
jgi:thymidylate synthase